MTKTSIKKASKGKSKRRATKSTAASAPTERSLRGFASMSPERRKALGSKGGKTAHAKGTANKFNSETASLAGRLPHINGTAHRWTSEEAREAGRKGAIKHRQSRLQMIELAAVA